MVHLSADLKEKLALATLKDTINDQLISDAIRSSAYKGNRKPTVEEICPEQTLKNRR